MRKLQRTRELDEHVLERLHKQRRLHQMASHKRTELDIMPEELKEKEMQEQIKKHILESDAFAIPDSCIKPAPEKKLSVRFSAPSRGQNFKFTPSIFA